MLESWCERNTDLTQVEVVGALYPRPLPAEFSGILGALLFRSDTMGHEIAGYLANEGFPLPDGPFRLMLLALDDPEVQKLVDWKRYCCRINLYDHLRHWLKDRLEGQTAGFLFMQMGYLLGIFFGEETTDSVAATCRETVGYAGTQLGVSVHVTVSHTFSGCQSFSTAYRSIQDVEQSRIFYTDMLDPAYVITGDVFDRLTDRSQKAEFEHAFGPFIRLGDDVLGVDPGHRQCGLFRRFHGGLHISGAPGFQQRPCRKPKPGGVSGHG